MAIGEALFVLKYATQHHGVFAEGMEELHTITQTQAADRQVVFLRSTLSRCLRKGLCTHFRHVTKHVVRIHTQCHPVADIEAQTAVHLCEAAFTRVGVGKVIIGVDAVHEREVVSYCGIGSHTCGESNMLTPQGELHGYILQVAVQAIAFAV